MSDAPIIRAVGLTKRFGTFVAVDDLHFEVRRGSIFAFLGANGSGKSTTIRMLIGLLLPTSGEVSVDGIDVIHHPRRVRDHIGYMGQKVSLYQGLSLRENVEFCGSRHRRRALERRWGAVRGASLGDAGRKPESLPAACASAPVSRSRRSTNRACSSSTNRRGVDVRNRAFSRIIRTSRLGAPCSTTHFLEEVGTATTSRSSPTDACRDATRKCAANSAAIASKWMRARRRAARHSPRGFAITRRTRGCAPRAARRGVARRARRALPGAQIRIERRR